MTNPGSWLDEGCIGTSFRIDPNDQFTMYSTAIYWVITTLTTVGYGDYKGYTVTEYGFQMIVEFLGIGTFSYFMGSINKLVATEYQLQEIIDERNEEIEQWLRKLEKSRPKNFTKQVYDSIKEYTLACYFIDHNFVR